MRPPFARAFAAIEVAFVPLSRDVLDRFGPDFFKDILPFLLTSGSKLMYQMPCRRGLRPAYMAVANKAACHIGILTF
jgi:hypothetical protein